MYKYRYTHFEATNQTGPVVAEWVHCKWPIKKHVSLIKVQVAGGHSLAQQPQQYCPLCWQQETRKLSKQWACWYTPTAQYVIITVLKHDYSHAYQCAPLAWCPRPPWWSISDHSEGFCLYTPPRSDVWWLSWGNKEGNGTAKTRQASGSPEETNVRQGLQLITHCIVGQLVWFLIYQHNSCFALGDTSEGTPVHTCEPASNCCYCKYSCIVYIHRTIYKYLLASVTVWISVDTLTTLVKEACTPSQTAEVNSATVMAAARDNRASCMVRWFVDLSLDLLVVNTLLLTS